MPKSRKVHVLSVHSESGDHYGPFLFERKLNNDELFRFLHDEVCADECGDHESYSPEDDGQPGFGGTYFHVEWAVSTIGKAP